MNFRQKMARLAAISAAAMASVSAFAVDPTTAQEALAGVSTANTGYGPVMWGMAAAAVGILIGVKWIKRGRGAA